MDESNLCRVLQFVIILYSLFVVVSDMYEIIVHFQRTWGFLYNSKHMAFKLQLAIKIVNDPKHS
jgi:hypothetical protein